MTNQKHLRQIARATRRAVRECLYALSESMLRVAESLEPDSTLALDRLHTPLYERTMADLIDDLVLIDAEKRDNPGEVSYLQWLDHEKVRVREALSRHADKA